MVDFANTKLVQQLAGKGKLGMSLSEVEPVSNISFCRDQRVDAGSSLASRMAASWPGEFSLLKISVQAAKSQLI
jgi:hypothetical protein